MCLPHIKTFLKIERLNFSQMDQPDLMQKFHFIMDVTAHLNTLNKSLQGKESIALQMLEEVLTFERKMTVFATDVQRGTLHHFSFLKKFQEANDQLNIEYFHYAIVNMETTFVEKFCNFRKKKHVIFSHQSSECRPIIAK